MSIGTIIRAALKIKPRRYQIQGIRFAQARNGRALIVDDMGLGKTLQAIGWLAINPQSRPVVVVCPASAKDVWQSQLWDHARMDCAILSGKKQKHIRQSDIIIVNYDILHYHIDALLGLAPQVLILDECHRIKNRGIKRTRAALLLGKQAKHILALSGTPVINRPIEFFTTLNLIAPKLFPSFWDYAFRYCKPRRAFRGQGWNFNGASNLKELAAKIAPLMIRRMKSDVLTELPPKTKTIIPINIDNYNEYQHARNDFLDWLERKKGMAAKKKALAAISLVKISYLKMLVAIGKLQYIFNWLEDWLADNPAEKLVIFCIHKTIVKRILNRYPGIPCITGATPTAKRPAEIRRFQTNPKERLFLGNMRAAGESISLTAASTCIFIEMGLTPAEHSQAEDRIVRLGQKANHIDIFYFIGKDTIDESNLKLIERKQKIVSQILGDTNIINSADSLTAGLTKERKYGSHKTNR